MPVFSLKEKDYNNKDMAKISKDKLKKYAKILLVLLVVASISIALYFVLRHFGYTDVDKLKALLQSAGPWAIIVYILLRVGCTIFLSFMPACSMIFDLLSLAAFDYLHPSLIFLICFASVLLTSVVMDLIGRFGGNKAIIKILGKDEYEEAKDLVQEKGMVYVPVMYLLPIFPDDAICMVSGATKMNFWVHFIEIFLCRGIGCATIIFGVQFIPQVLVDNIKSLNWTFIGQNWLEYFKILVLIVSYLGLLFWFTRKIDKWLTAYLKKRNNIKNNK